MRYTSRAFPAYAFLPGRDPHPVRDPAGHSFGKEEAAQYAEPENWAESEDFLWGVDLYNHGYLWEAHEAWEGLWHLSKHDPIQADFLQGLIQCAAASLKIPMEQPAGLQKLSARGIERLEAVSRSQGGTYMGVELDEFTEAMRRFCAGPKPQFDARPRLELCGLKPL